MTLEQPLAGASRPGQGWPWTAPAAPRPAAGSCDGGDSPAGCSCGTDPAPGPSPRRRRSRRCVSRWHKRCGAGAPRARRVSPACFRSSPLEVLPCSSRWPEQFLWTHTPVDNWCVLWNVMLPQWCWVCTPGVAQCCAYSASFTL